MGYVDGGGGGVVWVCVRVWLRGTAHGHPGGNGCDMYPTPPHPTPAHPQPWPSLCVTAAAAGSAAPAASGKVTAPGGLCVRWFAVAAASCPGPPSAQRAYGITDTSGPAHAARGARRTCTRVMLHIAFESPCSVAQQCHPRWLLRLAAPSLRNVRRTSAQAEAPRMGQTTHYTQHASYSC